jgi:hypothetical protein
MVDERKFKELLDLKRKLKPMNIGGQTNVFWGAVAEVDGLTEQQFSELVHDNYVAIAVAYDVYVLRWKVAKLEQKRKG